MTTLHDYQQRVGHLLATVDRSRHRIRQIDAQLADHTIRQRESARVEAAVNQHWHSYRNAVHTSGGAGALALIDTSTPPAADAYTPTVSDDDLKRRQDAAADAATRFRNAELRAQHHDTRWARRIRVALIAIAAAIACFVAYIALQVVVALLPLIIFIAIAAAVVAAIRYLFF